MTAIRAILTILAIMAWFNMDLNMVVMDVYGKIRKNLGHQWKRNWKNFSGSKDIAKSKSESKLGPFSFVFWPRFSTSLKDPLGCSELAEIFFGAYWITNEWDKCVAGKIWVLFDILNHPNLRYISSTFLVYISYLRHISVISKACISHMSHGRHISGISQTYRRYN